MNETLYYEPVFEPALNAQFTEFDDQTPEYVNPAWDDDALYNLILTYQDVLVDVEGETMTLSAAMNRHPGPWIPENEPNLIAYAEDLLARSPIELMELEEEFPEEIVSEQVTELLRPEELPMQNVTEQVRVAKDSEQPDIQQETTTPARHNTLPVSPEPSPIPAASTEVKSGSRTVDEPEPIKRDTATENERSEVSLAVETPRSETDEYTEMAKYVVDAVPSKEVEQVRVRELRTDEFTSIETIDTETMEIVGIACEEDDAVIDTEEPAPVYETASDTEVADYEPIEELTFEIGQEVLFNESENAAAEESLLESIPAYGAQPDESERIEVYKHSQTEFLDEATEEIESTLLQLAELISSDTLEDDENIKAVVRTILEAPIKLDAETKEEWAVLYVEIFEAAGMAYTPELIESLSALAIEWNLIDEIERLDDAEYDVASGEDGNTRSMVRRLLVAFATIVQAIRHVFTIGSYALKIYLAPRVGCQ